MRKKFRQPVKNAAATKPPSLTSPNDAQSSNSTEIESIPTAEKVKNETSHITSVGKQSLRPIPTADVNAPLAFDTYQQQSGEPPIERQNKILFAASTALLLIIVIVSAAVLVMYQKNASQEASPTPLPTQPVLPTATPAFSRMLWNMEVQNGSGVAGSAAKAAQQLSDLGYKIASIGNADKAGYKGVNVYIAASMQSFQSELIKDLASLYPSATYSGELIGATTSARIIIGK